MEQCTSTALKCHLFIHPIIHWTYSGVWYMLFALLFVSGFDYVLGVIQMLYSLTDLPPDLAIAYISHFQCPLNSLFFLLLCQHGVRTWCTANCRFAYGVVMRGASRDPCFAAVESPSPVRLPGLSQSCLSLQPFFVLQVAIVCELMRYAVVYYSVW